MVTDHAPLFDTLVFTKLQMAFTLSGKLCSCFKLQILLLCGSLPLTLPSTFVGLGVYNDNDNDYVYSAFSIFAYSNALYKE